MDQPTSLASTVHEQSSTDPPFRFYLLGELRIVYRGEPIVSPPHRTHSLLAALLLDPHPQHRDRLAGMLTPDRAEHAGRRRLSDLLWLLRRSVPDLPLETNSQQVYLPPSTRWLDVEAFDQAAAQSDLNRWLKALSLYRGELATGVYDDWLLTRRETLYLQYVHLGHRACEQLIQRQRFDEALPLAERLVLMEPYDEEALRTLIRVYQAMGRRGAALAAYDRFVALAAEELGVEPESATQALAQAIRSGSPHVAPAPAASFPTHVRDPDALLSHAREALERGDRTTVDKCLEQLGAFSTMRQDDVCLLAIDRALFFEEYDRVDRLLASCDTRSAPVLARVAQLALARHQTTAAHDAASEALVLAHEIGDHQVELDALLVLARTQCNLGQWTQGLRSAEQALSLARASASPANVAQALAVRGRIQERLGDHDQTLTLFHEARSLAHEHGLRHILADALHNVSMIHYSDGKLLDALTTQREALSIWRDLGLRSREISSLHMLGLFYAMLGRTAECLHALQQAGEICQQLGNPIRIARNRYHLADTLLYHDEALAPQAIAEAQQALAVFQAHDQSGWEASTLTTLGCALWLDGQHDAALEAYSQACALHERLKEMNYLPGLLALRALAHLDLGQHVQALEHTRQALLIMAQGKTLDEVFSEVYYAHAMVLVAHGEEETAQSYFARAYQHLLSTAAQLEDEPARQALFHRSPLTRRLMHQVYARGIAPEPTSGVVTRRLPAARDGRPLQVTLTMDAGPADMALKQARGAIALRQARLARLLREAQLQGATPTVAHLADVLGVSKRTIKRDLAALRDAQARD